MKKLLYLTCIILSLESFAQTTHSYKSIVTGFRIDFEQDVMLELMGVPELNSDQNYTQGGGISLFINPDMGWSRFLHCAECGDRDTGRFIVAPTEISIQLGAFTPDELRDSLPIVGDRPYSTLLMLGMKHSVLNIRSNEQIQKGIYIGLLGIDGPARSLQTAIHVGMNDNNTKPPYNPMGWHNQISNGGELTLMYSYSKTKLITADRLNEEIEKGNKSSSCRKHVLSYSYGYQIGYLTRLTGGLTYKFGKLDLSNWASDLFNPLGLVPEIADPDQPDQLDKYYSLDKQRELYFFAGITPAITFYNASLHGGFRDTEYRLDYWDTGFINAQARVGFGSTGRFHTFSLYWAFKSPEMWNEYARIHSWGGVSLGFHWR